MSSSSMDETKGLSDSEAAAICAEPDASTKVCRIPVYR